MTFPFSSADWAGEFPQKNSGPFKGDRKLLERTGKMDILAA
jgi:hypothetical protein